MTNKISIVKIQVAIMSLYLLKSERIVMVRNAKALPSAPIKNGLTSSKVNVLKE